MAGVQNFLDQMLDHHLGRLSTIRNSDIMAIYTPMVSALPGIVRNRVETLSQGKNFNGNLTILLDTGGGLVDAVERMVDVIRQYYFNVDFIIPDKAMSAGTIFALSGDNIYMDYFSLLGPIDPQFLINDEWVPGLGYLEKFNELNEKSAKGTLTPLEYTLVQKMDLADLHRYEQARDHSVELLESWLPSYKFKNWIKTESKNKRVTKSMKQTRAHNIAMSLNDTKRWHAHSRGISMKLLQEELKLQIEDLSNDDDLAKATKDTHTFMVDYMVNSQVNACIRVAPLVPNEDKP